MLSVVMNRVACRRMCRQGACLHSCYRTVARICRRAQAITPSTWGIGTWIEIFRSQPVGDQSGSRTLASGSRDPNARAAAVRIEGRDWGVNLREALNLRKARKPEETV